MSRKNIMRGRARVQDGRVTITFYKGTPLFRARKGPCHVRILRSSEPEFEFGSDYEEFFDGLDWRRADVLFDGVLTAENDRKFTYVDDTVDLGFTGAYWVQLHGDPEAVGPVPVRVRDPYIWWSAERLEHHLLEVTRENVGAATLETMGTTARGRPIKALFAGAAQPCVAFIGLVHPGESGPELLIPMLKRLLRERPELLEHASVAMLPVVAVDGREDEVAGAPWYVRTNANGVDINRNFPADWEDIAYGYGLDSSDPDAATYRGPSPASEPETQAVLAFIKRCNPIAVFSFHCLASICSNAFLTSGKAEGDAAFTERATRLATWYQQGMFPRLEGPATLHFSCSSGSLPHWLYRQRAVPAFDLELGPDTDAKACVRDETTRELLDTYRKRHYGGLVNVLQNFRQIL